MLYGFTIYKNPYASVDLYASMDKNSRNFDIKSEALEKLGICYQTEPFKVTSVEPFPNKLLIFLRQA